MGLGLPVIATCGACAAWENDGPRHSPRGYCAHKNRPRTDEWFHRDEDPDAAPPPGCPLPRPAAEPVQPSAPPVDRELLQAVAKAVRDALIDRECGWQDFDGMAERANSLDLARIVTDVLAARGRT